jgi:dethiobiotin synthetase
MKGLFVTGTDTGVGKTFISCELVRRARAAGHRVFAFKPIETGVTGEWGDDQLALAKASGSNPRGTYRLPLAAAPLVAARAAGTEIDLGRIEIDLLSGVEGSSRILIEAAGGWRVPITDQHGTSELARRSGLPVLIVARAGLGTINHTLLTHEAISRDGLRITGIVLSVRPDDDQELVQSNAEMVSRGCGLVPFRYPTLPEL